MIKLLVFVVVVAAAAGGSYAWAGQPGNYLGPVTHRSTGSIADLGPCIQERGNAYETYTVRSVDFGTPSSWPRLGALSLDHTYVLVRAVTSSGQAAIASVGGALLDYGVVDRFGFALLTFSPGRNTVAVRPLNGPTLTWNFIGAGAGCRMLEAVV